jgi:hypothetical protein
VILFRVKINFILDSKDKTRICHLANKSSKLVFPAYDIMTEIVDVPEENMYFKDSSDPMAQLSIKVITCEMLNIQD